MRTVFSDGLRFAATVVSGISVLMGGAGLISQRALAEEKPSSRPNRESRGLKTALRNSLTDWTCWRGPNGDGKTGVKGIKTDWSQGLTVVWKVKGLGGGYASPVIQGDRLVFAGHVRTKQAVRDGKKYKEFGAGKDTFSCLNADTGELLWKGEYPVKHLQSNHQAGPGPHGTPYIDGDRVYTQGGYGHVTCWNLADGKQIWQRNLLDEGGGLPFYGYTISPLVCGDKVIVQGGGDAQVIAFDKTTGEVAWKTGKGKATYAAPTAATINGKPQIVVATGGKILGLEPETGKEVWSFPFTFKHLHHVHTTPVVSGDIVFVTSAYRYKDKGVAIRIGRDNKVTQLWGSKTTANVHSDPIVLDGYLYNWSGGRGLKEQCMCVELETGKEVWTLEVDPEGRHDTATIVYVDGYLLFKTHNGRFGLIEAKPDVAKKVADWRPPRSPSRRDWTIPVVARGRLYNRYRGNLTCYDLMK